MIFKVNWFSSFSIFSCVIFLVISSVLLAKIFNLTVDVVWKERVKPACLAELPASAAGFYIIHDAIQVSLSPCFPSPSPSSINADPFCFLHLPSTRVTL